MNILQIATTSVTKCGVGIFAQSLANALTTSGVVVKTINYLPKVATSSDLILLHYHPQILSINEIEDVRYFNRLPLVLFLHEPGPTEICRLCDGLITMSNLGVSEMPVRYLSISLPAFIPGVLTDRGILKANYGIDRRRVVIGSCGFIFPHREFFEITEQLIPYAIEHDWIILLNLTPHFSTTEDALVMLRKFASCWPEYIRMYIGFLRFFELNQRLQMCDLLWCWTNRPSAPYSSAVLSDMYASGTRILTVAKTQHNHITYLPNVRSTSASRVEFLAALVTEAMAQSFPRHDPSVVAWELQVTKILNFLNCVCRTGARNGF